jgi:hypothetical protein
MTLQRRTTDRGELTEAMEHFLVTGCWAAPSAPEEEKLEIFMLAATVLRGHRAALRRVWAVLGPQMNALHPGKTFCEEMLAGHLDPIDTESWPQPFGRCRCRDHTD